MGCKSSRPRPPLRNRATLPPLDPGAAKTAAPAAWARRAVMAKFVFRFSEGDKDQKDLLGGTGANLAEMTKIALPVPPGFTITTEACRAYMRDGHVPPELRVEVTMSIRE